MSGAIDISKCGNWRGWRLRECMCAPCIKCGWGPHMAIHGPLDGHPPGSKPWGHEYLAPTTPRLEIAGR